MSTSLRRHRPAWLDLRFLIGVLLVVASVAGVWMVVRVARDTEPVYMARHALTPGQVVTAADLMPVDVTLGSATGAYLSPDDAIDEIVVSRVVGAGEFVPSDAVVSAEEATTTTLVVRSAADVPAAVAAGSVVDVWAAPRVDAMTFDTPRILVADAVVVSVEHDDSPLAAGTASVELVVPRAAVAEALAAISGGAAMSVVPAAPVAAAAVPAQDAP